MMYKFINNYSKWCTITIKKYTFGAISCIQKNGAFTNRGSGGVKTGLKSVYVYHL
jgi:hypothetical protein